MTNLCYFIVGLLPFIGKVDSTNHQFTTLSIHTPRVQSEALYIERHPSMSDLTHEFILGEGVPVRGKLDLSDTSKFYIIKIEDHRLTKQGYYTSNTLSTGILRASEKGWKIQKLHTTSEDFKFDFAAAVR